MYTARRWRWRKKIKYARVFAVAFAFGLLLGSMLRIIMAHDAVEASPASTGTAIQTFALRDLFWVSTPSPSTVPPEPATATGVPIPTATIFSQTPTPQPQPTLIQSPTPAATSEHTYLGTFRLTGYCCCTRCTPGHGITASGTTPVQGRTVAIDGIAFGTIIWIEGLGIYTVEDRGAGPGIVDVYMEKHADCYQPQINRENVPVWVIP